MTRDPSIFRFDRLVVYRVGAVFLATEPDALAVDPEHYTAPPAAPVDLYEIRARWTSPTDPTPICMDCYQEHGTDARTDSERRGVMKCGECEHFVGYDDVGYIHCSAFGGWTSEKSEACKPMQDLAACQDENRRLRVALAEAIGHLRFAYDCDLYSGSHVHDCKNCSQNEDPPGCDAKPILDKLWEALKGKE